MDPDCLIQSETQRIYTLTSEASFEVGGKEVKGSLILMSVGADGDALSEKVIFVPQDAGIDTFSIQKMDEGLFMDTFLRKFVRGFNGEMSNGEASYMRNVLKWVTDEELKTMVLQGTRVKFAPATPSS